MPQNTPKGFPYPVGTDRVMDGDDAIRNLATAVDGKLGLCASGIVTIPITAANTIASAAVTFPAGLFTATPQVVMGQSGAGSTGTISQRFWNVTGVSATGFNAVGVNTAGSATFVCNWIAQQT